MPWVKESLPRRVWSSVADVPRGWWHEATRPFGKSGLSPARELFRRFLLWAPLIVLVLVAIGGTGLYFFTGWRAHDLARKAMDNAQAGKIQMAWLQVSSAGNLRGQSPEVRRVMVYVRSAANDPAALALWDELAADMKLTAEENKERARAAARFGTEEQFAAAVAALEQEGDAAEVATWRAQRALRRGNLQQSIDEARAAAETSGDAEKKIQLLALLLRRHAPMLNAPGEPAPQEVRAAEQIVELVDGLQGTDQGNKAIALALGAFPKAPEKSRTWAESAMTPLSTDNPALLPAAYYLVRSGAETAPDMHRRLSAVYAGAAPAKQAQLAEFLTSNGMAQESLLLITPKKAAADPAAFEERGRALAALGKWDELLALSETAANTTESSKLFFRGCAAKNLGKTTVAHTALADAFRASVREGNASAILSALDSIGEGKASDPAIIEMCGSAETADGMFRVARARFGRRGQFASLAQAYDAAAKAKPDAPSVQDYRRRSDLLAGKTVSSAETAAAVASAPADPSPRFTHALALLSEDRAGDALGVFHDVDIFVDQLPPGDKAIAIALWEANGMNGHAASLRRSLDPALLEKGEYALILR
jgi:hypothetical protein